MKLAKDDLIAALRVRYDYYSAQTMFELARNRAGLVEQAAYDAAEVRAFRTALTSVGDRVDGVLARLDLVLGTPDAEAKPASPPEPASAPDPVQAKPASVPEPIPVKPASTSEPAPTKANEPTPVKPAKHRAKPTDAPSEPATARKLIETTVTLADVELAKGEHVMMCGGSDELGDWDPEHAYRMVRDGDRWLAKLELAPEAEVEFKFLRQAADGDVVWEDGEDRRLLAGVRLDATWR